MKSLLLSVTLMAFAIAAHAGDAKKTTEKAACCSETKATQAKASCPIAAAAAAKEAKTCSATASACSSATSCKDAPTKQALLSPKAAAEVAKKL